MSEFVSMRNEKLANYVIKGINSRNMTGYSAADKAEALKIALSLIQENSSVTMGGCMSARELAWLMRSSADRTTLSTVINIRTNGLLCSPLMTQTFT